MVMPIFFFWGGGGGVGRVYVNMVNTLCKIQDSENLTLLSGTYCIYLNKRRSWDKLFISTVALI